MGTEGARPTTPARAARAVAVVCLLGIAAVSLSGRRGLDRDRLTRVPDVAWVRVVLGGLAVVLVLVAVRRLIQLWRKLRPRRPEPPAQTEGRAVPWLGWLVAAAVVAATVVTGYLVIRVVLNQVPDAGFTGAASPGGPRAVGSPGGLLPLLMGMVLVLALAVAVYLRYRGTVIPLTDEPEDASDADLLAGAVVAAERAMERHDETRAAIIAAYVEMTARLSRAPGHHASDTPTELLDRAVSAGLVSRGAALELTELFREARFSRHQLDHATRGAAEVALARVSAELAMTHA